MTMTGWLFVIVGIAIVLSVAIWWIIEINANAQEARLDEQKSLLSPLEAARWPQSPE